MNDIERALVLTAAKTQPKLFNLIAQAIDLGATKETIMQKVTAIAPEWSLTAGLCDAVGDFFLSDEGQRIVVKAKRRAFRV